MRCSLFAVTGVLFAALLAPQSSNAAGNVLLPHDDSNKTSLLPNLGISVVPSTPAPAPVAEPIKKPETPAPVPKPIPAPIAPPKKVEPPVSSNSTRIITETEPPAQIGEGLPYALTVSYSEKSVFGEKDIATVTDRLGLNREQISKSCLLATRGMVSTAKSMYSVPLRPSPQTTVRYDTPITNLMLTAQAMCVVDGNIPQKGGVITKMGDRFIVPLQGINCAAPRGAVTNLIFTYDGSGTSQCYYQ